MYCVFHHISDHLQRLILFWQFYKKVGLRSDPRPPWLVQKTKFVKGNISGAPLNVPRLPPPQNLPSVSSDKSTVDFSNEIYFVSDTWNF